MSKFNTGSLPLCGNPISNKLLARIGRGPTNFAKTNHGLYSEKCG